MDENFTWEIQKAGYEFSQYDFKGEIDYECFIKEFNTFPWREQLIEANKKSDKVSPSIFVNDKKENKVLWVAVYGNPDEKSFIVGYVYLKKRRKIWMPWKSEKINWLEMFETQSVELIEKYFGLQFERLYDELYSELKLLKKYGVMESKS